MEKIDHIAIVVTNIAEAVRWYTNKFDCKVTYEDKSWAELQFDNIKLALVLPQDHPAHIAFESDDWGPDTPTKHRDGSESVYDHDTFGNIIEYIKYGR
jgi:catechol 2,3-dioxygenase-like lactoylglutathione lyase family enzyme|tara:strand:+ start:270 stop:563 length:294 start_codon:yes stop_codon:yes gene_type:complete